ncbi:hypothetical protein DTO013E5_5763 [Penicillium roqueforti]|uniref:Genomic scaffold, ProqFM164S02 n=1 Tax=Penicillium roqueforti (strain FM164) TaxID=1365484 RepID=W6QU26_PENRF|nr:uncharacterized protein LCP9604111_7895 [Penicillium roqueforti]CDM33037.1 unnamed protein product [Penicillium roqueforti FM164]KAF9242712.1 hypothetical protein LCP9604111_7895 [Penicillium roqueforti]KAI1830582.1 hypothetical protein CBS147337_8648 [Penicillium roqueforti]KAI2674334.1 hypothetical protein CBS147355_6948 [Penicillium roqueforti]KAI2684009.1 hypothetical protein LCP963914a_5839 [Penicillium roqueforti]
MYFSKGVIAVTASFVSLGLAADPLSFTSWPKEPLQPGKPVTLTWTGATPGQPVTILLRQGSSGDLQDVKPITTDGKGGTFTWTPDNDVKSGDTYAFQILQKDQTNYTALLKSAGKPAADIPEAKDTTETGTATSTAAATGTSTGATDTSTGTSGTTTGTENTTGTSTGTTAQTTDAPNTQTTGTTETTHGTHTTMTSTASKALINSAVNSSGSPSSSSHVSSTDKPMATSTEVVDGKKASSTGSVQTGAASIPQYSVQLVMGIAGLLACLV